jgi:hypothetical protein
MPDMGAGDDDLEATEYRLQSTIIVPSLRCSSVAAQPLTAYGEPYDGQYHLALHDLVWT